MSYTLTEVKELPAGRTPRVSPTFYNDIIKDFTEKQWTYAKVDVPDKNPDNVVRSLEYKIDDTGISVFIRLGKVYLLNHALVPQDEV